MNLGFWGVKLPIADTINDPARALPVTDVGPVALVAMSSEILAPTDSSAKTLTVPSGAVKAVLQVNGSAAWYTMDGDTPVIASVNGFKVADQAFIEVYGKHNMETFKILAHTSGTPKVYVEYYGYERIIDD